MHTTIQKHEDVCTDQSMVMAWSTIGPALRKGQKMTKRGYISGTGDRLGSAGPTVTKTSITTPQNSMSDKAGLCKAQIFAGT